jgi:hypothetical protein
MRRKTTLSIDGADFFINGRPTYEHRADNGIRVEGLLINCRMVQGIFDDLNPETRSWSDYPDGPWDAERNAREFVDAMSEWRDNGLLSFTINLQGGSPHGYSDGEQQPRINSAFDAAGDLRSDYMARLRPILDRADELGMAPITVCDLIPAAIRAAGGEGGCPASVGGVVVCRSMALFLHHWRASVNVSHTGLTAGGRWIRTIGTPQSFLAVPSIPPIHLPKYYADCIKGTKGLRYIYDKRNKIQMERHLEKYGDWVVSEFGEDGRRSRLITWYVFDPDRFRRHEPGWCGTSITEYRNGMPSHVTLLDAAGLEVEAWAVDGDGRRVVDFSGPR